MEIQSFTSQELRILTSAGDVAMLLSPEAEILRTIVCNEGWGSFPFGDKLSSLVPPEDEEALVAAHTKAKYGSSGKALTRVFRRDKVVWVDWRSGPFDQRGNVLMVGRDVSDEVNALESLRSQALMDTLTSLPNRAALTRELNRRVTKWESDGTPFSVLFVDLDGFKRVNDSLGHPTGDSLLLMAATRLRQNLRDDDFLARMGGDEFVVVCPHVAPKDAASSIGARIVNAMKYPFRLDNRVLYIGASVGVSGCPSDSSDPVRLLSFADMALYRSKASGKGCVTVFNAFEHDTTSLDVGFDSTLHDGMIDGEFRLVYQPIVNVRTREIEGVEALMRWTRKTGEEISPAVFIPAAESRGLIGMLGTWSLRRACVEIVRATGAGADGPYVSVNVSPRQFREPSFLSDVRTALTMSQLPAGRLQLEITEGALVEDPDEATRMLTELRGLGVRVAVDDFGTGYSSLAYLKTFPLTALKIDRTFVKELPLATKDRAICSSVCAMARDLELSVVAEGVETEPQLATLQELGCTNIQGYLTGRPAEMTDVFPTKQAEGDNA